MHSMSSMLILVSAILFLIAAAIGLMISRMRLAATSIISQPVLTNAEAAFHQKLSQAVARIGGLTIHPQMAMSAFLQPRPGMDRKSYMATFRRFSQKRPDFVLVDREWHVRLIVELDDATHDPRRDALRDEMTKSAGIATVRFKNVITSTTQEIQTRISQALV